MVKSYVTARSHDLSLWQSVVHHVADKAPGIDPARRSLMHQAVDAHVTALTQGLPIPLPASIAPNSFSLDDHTALSAANFTRAQALQKSGSAAAAISGGYWAYSNYDIHWAECIVLYNEYYVVEGNTAVYRDWTTYGGNNINFGVIDYQLPNDATVLVIGDWGTGMNDAVTMLQAAISTHNPTAIIHLGDIYYSGTAGECNTNVVQALNQIFNNLHMDRVPVFMIPGNHEYYSGGQGFYNTIDVLNNGVNSCLQQASYFCLRTQDLSWQFLGMDTGVNDHDADMDALGTVGLNPLATGPGLVPSEATWQADKLQGFAGNTILMSHHQVFSANAAINGWATPYPPYMNGKLFETFLPFFNQVSAWFWGHEHNFAYFQDGLFGLNKGRLLGNSAYEELTSSNPYTVNYPAIPYAPNMVKVTTTPYSTGSGVYYNHAFAVISLARAATTDPISVSYYQFPSWGTSTPPNPMPQASLMYTEQIGAPSFAPVAVWSGNTAINTPNGAPLSSAGPSLVLFNDSLYMAYVGQSSNTIYLAWFNGTAWDGNIKISSMSGGISPETNMTPALAVFGGKLYLIYKGAHSNTLYAAWYDGTTWGGNVSISSMAGGISPSSNLAPAAMGFGGQLVVVYKGQSTTSLYAAYFNGTSWSGNKTISTSNGAPASSAGPTLAIFAQNGQPAQLCMGYIGAYTTNLYTSWFDGTTWSGNNQVTIPAGNPASSNAPWMSQVGDELVMLYTGASLSNIYASSYNGTSWSGNQQLGKISPISPQSSSTGAMAPYGNGAMTAYLGALTTTLYQARVQIIGSATTTQAAAAASMATA